jgi:hypothetical protein
VFIKNSVELWKLWIVTFLYLASSSVILYFIETNLSSQSSNHAIHTLWDAIYVTFISFAVIGFGVKYPLSPIGRILSILHGFVGVIIFGVIIWIVIQTFQCTDPEVIEVIGEKGED